MKLKKKAARRSAATRKINATKQLAEKSQAQTPAALTIARPQTMALQPFAFNEEQIALIKTQCCAVGTTPDEFKLFMHVAEKRGLDPLQKQIYAIKRKVKRKQGSREWYEDVMSIQVGIDGFRSIADRTKCYAPSDKAVEYKYDNAEKIFSATVWVKKFAQGEWHEYSGTAVFSEYAQATSMWTKMPHNQLEKCAEAKALRRGWPEQLGQIYIPEEMSASESHDGTEPPKQTKTRETGTLQPEIIPPKDVPRSDVSKMSESTQSNRGHGDEQLDQAHGKSPTPDCPTCATFKRKCLKCIKREKEEKTQTADPTQIPGVKRGVDELKKKADTTTIRARLISAKWKKKDAGENPKIWFVVELGNAEGGVTTFWCWHQSLFHCFDAFYFGHILKFVIKAKVGNSYPTIEDVLNDTTGESLREKPPVEAEVEDGVGV